MQGSEDGATRKAERRNSGSSQREGSLSSAFGHVNRLGQSGAAMPLKSEPRHGNKFEMAIRAGMLVYSVF